MFNPSRDQARDFFFESWRKYRAQQDLSALESSAVELIAAHPEYHALLENRDKFIDRDFSPERGETNPFLHLSMHLAIREQISIDQPAGVRAEYTRLARRRASALEAEHEMMECLGEMIWQAQRAGTPPDAAIYFACLKKKS